MVRVYWIFSDLAYFSVDRPSRCLESRAFNVYAVQQPVGRVRYTQVYCMLTLMFSGDESQP